LVAINLGRAPDGTVINSPSGGELYSEIPYVILYNKYRGKLRVFGNTFDGINNPQHAVKITLQFKNLSATGQQADVGYSPLFMLQKNIAQPLDQETQIVKVFGLSGHPDNFGLWFHADFDVAY